MRCCFCPIVVPVGTVRLSLSIKPVNDSLVLVLFLFTGLDWTGLDCVLNVGIRQRYGLARNGMATAAWRLLEMEDILRAGRRKKLKSVSRNPYCSTRSQITSFQKPKHELPPKASCIRTVSLSSQASQKPTTTTLFFRLSQQTNIKDDDALSTNII